MYTNIDTHHAFNVIEHSLRTQQPDVCKQESICIDALIASLQIIMTHNDFKFGDTFWVQLTETAMGTTPAPVYATLYFAIYEIHAVLLFPQLKYYGRYIDDVLAIWEPQPDTDNQQIRKQFQDQINSFEKLKWETSHLSKSVNFLVLTISINIDLTIETKLFKKALNLYLYLPPHSAHTQGVLKGLSVGMIHCIFQLNSNKSHIKPALNDFYKQLRACGYQERTLQHLFTKYLDQVARRLIVESTTDNTTNYFYLHVSSHLCNPPLQALQKSFANAMLQLSEEPLLADL